MACIGSLGGSGRGVGPVAKSVAAGSAQERFGGRGRLRDQLSEKKGDERAMGVRISRVSDQAVANRPVVAEQHSTVVVADRAASSSFDIVITNGHIVDGTGSPWYSGDVGIRAGKIAAIGNLADAQRNRTIDAHGMVVAPGFIDMLGQSELTILVEPATAFEDLPGHHYGDYWRRRLGRAPE